MWYFVLLQLCVVTVCIICFHNNMKVLHLKHFPSYPLVKTVSHSSLFSPPLSLSLPLQLTLSDLVNKMPELIPGNARLYPTVDVEDMGFPGWCILHL